MPDEIANYHPPPRKVFSSIPVEVFFAKSNYFAPIRLIAAGDVFVRN